MEHFADRILPRHEILSISEGFSKILGKKIVSLLFPSFLNFSRLILVDESYKTN